ncbi:MAG: hypothetical protein J6Y21_11055 [Clostridia bacterium]|nr:hypothetical protein [Clostridia bacterium]
MPEDNDFSFDIFDIDGDGKLDAAETQLLYDHLEESEENFAPGRRAGTYGSSSARRGKAVKEPEVPEHVSRREYEDKKLEFVKDCVIGIVILMIAAAIDGVIVYVFISSLDFSSAVFSVLILGGGVVVVGAIFAALAIGTVSALADVRSTLKK